jgi:nitrogen fixation protein FixH
MIKNGRLYPGAEMTVSVSFTDSDGTAVDPDTVTFKLREPCGTITSYVYGTDSEVARSSAGNYTATFTPDKGGRWFCRWESTGTGKKTTADEMFIVTASPFVDYIVDKAYQL